MVILPTNWESLHHNGASKMTLWHSGFAQKARPDFDDVFCQASELNTVRRINSDNKPIYTKYCYNVTRQADSGQVLFCRHFCFNVNKKIIYT